MGRFSCRSVVILPLAQFRFNRIYNIVIPNTKGIQKSSVVLLGDGGCKGCPLSKFAPESHLDDVLVACPLVERLALLERGAVQVQAGRTLCVTSVLNAVQADRVIDVGNLVVFKDPLGFLHHVSLSLPLWPLKQCFLQLPLQHLHEAVGIGVVVDTTAVALSPTQDHEVELPIALIYQISGVPEWVEFGKLHPLLRVAVICFHYILYLVHIDIVTLKDLMQHLNQII